MASDESSIGPNWEPTPRWERRRREVLDAAATAFAEKGYLGASIKDIADRLGVRQASLYYYFPSKEAALAALQAAVQAWRQLYPQGCGTQP